MISFTTRRGFISNIQQALRADTTCLVIGPSTGVPEIPFLNPSRENHGRGICVALGVAHLQLLIYEYIAARVVRTAFHGSQNRFHKGRYPS